MSEKTEVIPMGVNFNQPVLDLDGSSCPARDGEEVVDLRLGQIVCNALLASDREATGDQMLERTMLAMKIKGESAAAEFPSVPICRLEAKMILACAEQFVKFPLYYTRIHQAVSGSLKEE